ncbi:MAG: hypothetical protein JNK82_22330, partial [Myxococcaceae bacterium]|nr:hypothetical protein [Myxococcaceae bacterium]
MAHSPDEDPLLELRESLGDDDEPLFGGAAPPPAPTRASAPSQPGVPAVQAPPMAPPPLPPRPKPQTQAEKPVSGNHAAHQPARISNQTQVQLPKKPPTGVFPPGTLSPVPPSAVPQTLALPSPVPRPTGSDPFQEAPEPRLPPGGDPEEKLKAFRTMLKLKDEALARGRGLYGAVDHEAQALRQVALQLKTQLEAALIEAAKGSEYPQQIAALKEMLEKDTVRAESAERKMDELVSRLAESDADRKDLQVALAEIETALNEQKAQLENERLSRQQLADELVGAKEALGISQDRVSDLAATASDVKGQLEAATEEYQRYAREAEESQLTLESTREELATVTSERDAARAEVEALRSENEGHTSRASGLESQLEEFRTKAQTLESEAEWSKSSSDQAQARVVSLEQEKSALAAKVAELQAQVADLSGQLEAANEAREAVEAELAGVQDIIAGHETTIGNMRLEADGFRAREKQHEHDLQKAKTEVETAAIKKLRDELNQANKRAMDAGAQLRQVKADKDAAESRIAAAENQVGDSDARAKLAEDRVRAAEARVIEAEKKAAELHQAALKGGDAKLKAEMEKVKALENKVLSAEKQWKEAQAKVDAASKQAAGASEAVARMKQLEEELKKVKAAPAAAAAAGGGAASAEVEKLKADLAAMKKKAMEGENAKEAVVLLKSKVAKLEAQLKGG